jgi:hypothetical protein
MLSEEYNTPVPKARRFSTLAPEDIETKFQSKQKTVDTIMKILDEKKKKSGNQKLTFIRMKNNRDRDRKRKEDI